LFFATTTTTIITTVLWQELRSMHEELVKQKSGFQSRIQTRDEEITRLRSQVILLFCSMNFVCFYTG